MVRRLVRLFLIPPLRTSGFFPWGRSLNSGGSQGCMTKGESSLRLPLLTVKFSCHQVWCQDRGSVPMHSMAPTAVKKTEELNFFMPSTNPLLRYDSYWTIRTDSAGSERFDRYARISKPQLAYCTFYLGMRVIRKKTRGAARLNIVTNIHRLSQVGTWKLVNEAKQRQHIWCSILQLSGSKCGFL